MTEELEPTIGDVAAYVMEHGEVRFGNLVIDSPGVYDDEKKEWRKPTQEDVDLGQEAGHSGPPPGLLPLGT